METTVLDPGFIGISHGEADDYQAIVWAGGEDFYFYPVSMIVARRLMKWNADYGDITTLKDILPEAPGETLSMLMYGEPEVIAETFG